MKGLLIATMLFSGGGAAAMQNEDVANTVNSKANEVIYSAQKMFRGSQIENVKENGIPYPSEEYLSTLTEEQQLVIISRIDVINATYDWSNMADEEIQAALDLVKEELHNLYLELGIEGPMVQTREQARKGNRHGGGGHNGGTPPYGDGTQDEDITDEDLPDSNDTA